MLDYRTHTFLAVCRAGSFTRAAERLHVTQPAVSQHVRQLERHYGQALFAKTTHGVEPTAAGALLYRALCAAENDEARLCAELGELSGEREARLPLRLGCTRTIADFVVPRLLAAHLAHHPEEQVFLHTGNTAELVSLIDAGEVDLALVEGSFDRRAFESATFSHEPFVAVAAPGTDRPEHVEELLGQRLVLREPGSGTREILERHLAAHELTVDDFAGIVELASIPAIKACVGAGVGVSFLYRVAVRAELTAGTLADVTPRELAIEHDFALIWQRGSHYAGRWRALGRAWRDAYAGGGTSTS